MQLKAKISSWPQSAQRTRRKPCARIPHSRNASNCGPFVTLWPTDDPGLSRAQRREVQTLLTARGHDIGEVDGMLGDRSRVAIRAEQERLGQEASGRAGQKLLKSLPGE